MKKNTLAAHNIRLLFWANLFGNVKFLQPVLALFYFARGLDESLILLVMLVWSTGVLIGEVPTGMFADRYGAKRSFLIGSFLSFGSHFILLWAFEPWVFFISSFLSGFAATFFSGADEALIYESLKESKEESKMDQAMGIIQSAGFIVMIFVVILGAILAKDLTNTQFTLLIMLGSGFQAVQMILVSFIRNPASHGNYRENPFKQIGEGLLAIKKAPQVLWMFLNISLVFIPAVAVFEQFDQKLLVDASLPVYLIGVVYAVGASISYFASRNIVFLTSKLSRKKLLVLSGFISAACLFVAGLFGSSLIIVLFVLFVLRFVNAIRYPIYSQLSNEYIPSNVRATTISLLSIVDSVCDILIFSTLSGIAVLGLTPMFMLCGLIALFGTLLPVRPAPKLSNEQLKIS
ncbi:MFS family permease [Salirhabdus euzebyi]|uniref:MFS family permease n=1 Tax=Salirhabdus euzebyi TaxID=394506 RepID=A0A841Q8T0_9BACI|nr:MFS transporter [Salirhabdus euzebyi]MBB6454795.1 MFS family permease [Salirhabdus euzebyi]